MIIISNAEFRFRTGDYKLMHIELEHELLLLTHPDIKVIVEYSANILRIIDRIRFPPLMVNFLTLKNYVGMYFLNCLMIFVLSLR